MEKSDSDFLKLIRAVSILVIVFGHVGGFWFYRPYSEFLYVFVPVFFFLSGAVSLQSFQRSETIRKYYFKRFISLLVPYYMICLLSLLVYILLHFSLPLFNLKHLLNWMLVSPYKSSFNIGQVWFIHSLLVITIFSPFFLYLKKKNTFYLFILLLLPFVLALIQLFADIDDYFVVFGHNFYLPIISSIFYITGILIFNPSFDYPKKQIFFWSILVLFISLILIIIYSYDIDIDLSKHSYSLDLYYVLVSMTAIISIVLSKDYLLNAMRRFNLLKQSINFLHKHTFSIFLLHSFVIFAVEKIFGLVHPQNNLVLYGIIKLLSVIIISLFISIPYTSVTLIIKKHIKTIGQ